MIALIPARSGSKRVKHKNVKPLGGIPLMCWTIYLAKQFFPRVMVSTDSLDYGSLASDWGAEVIYRRPEMATDTATDYPWIRQAIDKAREPCFALLRPTSPFRTLDELKRAHNWFLSSGADSIRAVQVVSEHPCKMWVVRGARMQQLIPTWPLNVMQTQSMPVVYWADSSLEMAWSRVLYKTHTYSGYDIAPFYTTGMEGFDIHSQADFDVAEAIVKVGMVKKPIPPANNDVLEWDET